MPLASPVLAALAVDATAVALVSTALLISAIGAVTCCTCCAGKRKKDDVEKGYATVKKRKDKPGRRFGKLLGRKGRRGVLQGGKVTEVAPEAAPESFEDGSDSDYYRPIQRNDQRDNTDPLYADPDVQPGMPQYARIHKPGRGRTDGDATDSDVVYVKIDSDRSEPGYQQIYEPPGKNKGGKGTSSANTSRFLPDVVPVSMRGTGTGTSSRTTPPDRVPPPLPPDRRPLRLSSYDPSAQVQSPKKSPPAANAQTDTYISVSDLEPHDHTAQPPTSPLPPPPPPANARGSLQQFQCLSTVTTERLTKTSAIVTEHHRRATESDQDDIDLIYASITKPRQQQESALIAPDVSAVPRTSDGPNATGAETEECPYNVIDDTAACAQNQRTPEQFPHAASRDSVYSSVDQWLADSAVVSFDHTADARGGEGDPNAPYTSDGSSAAPSYLYLSVLPSNVNHSTQQQTTGEPAQPTQTEQPIYQSLTENSYEVIASQPSSLVGAKRSDDLAPSIAQSSSQTPEPLYQHSTQNSTEPIPQAPIGSSPTRPQTSTTGTNTSSTTRFVTHVRVGENEDELTTTSTAVTRRHAKPEGMYETVDEGGDNGDSPYETAPSGSESKSLPFSRQHSNDEDAPPSSRRVRRPTPPHHHYETADETSKQKETRARATNFYTAQDETQPHRGDYARQTSSDREDRDLLISLANESSSDGQRRDRLGPTDDGSLRHSVHFEDDNEYEQEEGGYEQHEWTDETESDPDRAAAAGDRTVPRILKPIQRRGDGQPAERGRGGSRGRGSRVSPGRAPPRGSPGARSTARHGVPDRATASSHADGRVRPTRSPVAQRRSDGGGSASLQSPSSRQRGVSPGGRGRSPKEKSPSSSPKSPSIYARRQMETSRVGPFGGGAGGGGGSWESDDDSSISKSQRTPPKKKVPSADDRDRGYSPARPSPPSKLARRGLVPSQNLFGDSDPSSSYAPSDKRIYGGDRSPNRQGGRSPNRQGGLSPNRQGGRSPNRQPFDDFDSAAAVGLERHVPPVPSIDNATGKRHRFNKSPNAGVGMAAVFGSPGGSEDAGRHLGATSPSYRGGVHREGSDIASALRSENRENSPFTPVKRYESPDSTDVSSAFEAKRQRRIDPRDCPADAVLKQLEDEVRADQEVADLLEKKRPDPVMRQQSADPLWRRQLYSHVLQADSPADSMASSLQTGASPADLDAALLRRSRSSSGSFRGSHAQAPRGSIDMCPAARALARQPQFTTGFCCPDIHGLTPAPTPIPHSQSGDACFCHPGGEAEWVAVPRSDTTSPSSASFGRNVPERRTVPLAPARAVSRSRGRVHDSSIGSILFPNNE